MEKGWHYEQNVRISHLASEMVRLFVSGHDAEQTAQYEAVRKEYLRQQLVKGWHDVGYIPPPEHVVG